MAPAATTASAPAGTGQIRSVQALRAVAALFVVAFHATVLWRDRFDHGVTPWSCGNAGVDLFFVISGFIMVLSSRALRGQVDGWRRFLQLRLARIVPLYWLATAAKLAAIAAVPALALHTRPTTWNVIASFLFVPSRDALGVVRPVVDVGWTLSFEMLFYAVFAAALALRGPLMAVVAPAMVGLALVSLVVQATWTAPTTLADPIVLEFVLGMAVALVIGRGWLARVPACLALAACLAGLACLATLHTQGRWDRVAVWGGAAAVVLLAATLAESRFGRHVPGFAVQIGEASYALYLTHGFVLPAVGVTIAHSRVSGPLFGPVLVTSCLAASTASALFVYYAVEAPLTRRLRRLIGGQRARGLQPAPRRGNP